MSAGLQWYVFFRGAFKACGSGAAFGLAESFEAPGLGGDRGVPADVFDGAVEGCEDVDLLPAASGPYGFAYA